MAHQKGFGDSGLRVHRNTQIPFLSNSDCTDNSIGRNISKSLKSMYFKNKSVYFIWGEKRFTSKYIKTLCNKLDILFKHLKDDISPKEILNVIENKNLEPQYTTKAIRNFLNYLKEKELISDIKLSNYRNKN